MAGKAELQELRWLIPLHLQILLLFPFIQFRSLVHKTVLLTFWVHLLSAKPPWNDPGRHTQMVFLDDLNLIKFNWTDCQRWQKGI